MHETLLGIVEKNQLPTLIAENIYSENSFCVFLKTNFSDELLNYGIGESLFFFLLIELRSSPYTS